MARVEAVAALLPLCRCSCQPPDPHRNANLNITGANSPIAMFTSIWHHYGEISHKKGSFTYKVLDGRCSYLSDSLNSTKSLIKTGEVEVFQQENGGKAGGLGAFDRLWCHVSRTRL